MAMTDGMPCLRCDDAVAEPGSHFCSAECKRAFGASVDGPVECFRCDAGADSVAEAVAAGWVGVEPDLEGMSWNYLGLCPECQADEAAEVAEAQS